MIKPYMYVVHLNDKTMTHKKSCTITGLRKYEYHQTGKLKIFIADSEAYLLNFQWTA